ncbi:hypothetical protein BU14_0023s0023 [Porphyra umbilicalis]|uniref:R-phycoerythrin gamma chain, chloroplastic n=1 Tax=Porphyra umbilicalis TaxID=2786 RepID=A0A1X6PKI7_PORUM|nr:hypothetical protein BU14_0023s0023 [Porphyra umbilicalis]|eukprot:OSX81218.1 hypothetical protein BU14_0023s0023 [Porphyra umbilicalis]
MAFVSAVPVGAARVTVYGAQKSSFVSTTPAPAAAAATPAGPTMLLAARVRKVSGGFSTKGGSYAQIASKSDKYLAQTINQQYKRVAAAGGVYNVQCTEGSVSGMAEYKRIAAKTRAFRDLQKTPSQKYGDLYAMRSASIQVAHGCHTEEKMLVNNPQAAASYVVGQREAMRQCVRYATPESTEENYIASKVQDQMLKAVAPYGVFTRCTDGTVKGQAEEMRVAALNASYRTQQASAGTLAQQKYNQSAFGRSQANGCNYEECLCTTYPAAAASFQYYQN